MSKGDHIWVRRVGYTHHGVDVGDGTVIHYTGEPLSKRAASVRRTSMSEFSAGGAVRVRKYSDRRYDAEATVRRAVSRIGESLYRLDANNCEHFARWCVTGHHQSAQVDRGLGAVTGGTAVAAKAGATAAVATAGTVSGLSGPGIMTGLAAIGPGGAVGGAVTMAAGAGLGTAVLVNNTVLADSAALTQPERSARRDGRIASYGGATIGGAAGIATVSAAGTVAGLSGAGIMSGLAAIGSAVGGGAAAGVGVVVAGPAVLAASAGYGLYRLSRWFRD